MSVLVAFSVTPLGVGESVGEIVAEAVRVVRESGLPNKTGAMFTEIEGDTWEQVMTVVRQAVEAVAARHDDDGGLLVDAQPRHRLIGRSRDDLPRLGACGRDQRCAPLRGKAPDRTCRARPPPRWIWCAR